MKTIVYSFFFKFLSLLFLLLILCAPKSGQWQSKLLFSNEALASKRLSTGRSILLMPFITESSFDTSTALSPEVLTKTLVKLQENIKVRFKKDFEEACLGKVSGEDLDSFYVALFKNNILALTAKDSIWQKMPSQYVIIIRLNTGVRISSFDGILKRKAVLEGELWDAEKIEVVWRAQSSGFEMNDNITDAEFIADGMREIFKLFPDFIPIGDEENW